MWVWGMKGETSRWKKRPSNSARKDLRQGPSVQLRACMHVRLGAEERKREIKVESVRQWKEGSSSGALCSITCMHMYECRIYRGGNEDKDEVCVRVRVYTWGIRKREAFCILLASCLNIVSFLKVFPSHTDHNSLLTLSSLWWMTFPHTQIKKSYSLLTLALPSISPYSSRNKSFFAFPSRSCTLWYLSWCFDLKSVQTHLPISIPHPNPNPVLTHDQWLVLTLWSKIFPLTTHISTRMHDLSHPLHAIPVFSYSHTTYAISIFPHSRTSYIFSLLHHRSFLIICSL